MDKLKEIIKILNKNQNEMYDRTGGNFDNDDLIYFYNNH